MKRIVYYVNNPIKTGKEDAPEWVHSLVQKSIPYSENNEGIARNEAHNGEYTIEDDGQEETTASLSLETRVDTLEAASAEMAEALDMILNGVVE